MGRPKFLNMAKYQALREYMQAMDDQHRKDMPCNAAARAFEAGWEAAKAESAAEAEARQ